jgi:hypothetical protein
MDKFPNYLALALGFTTFLTVFFFYKAAGKSRITLVILLGWLLLQAIVGLSGFYTVTDVMPPRFMLTLMPPLILIAVLFATATGRMYIDRLNTKTLTLLHSIRVPVEFILLGLFLHKGIPQLMTFEGRNFDIIAGLTAPLIYYFGFVKNKLSIRLMLIWNFLCLVTLINIVANAILSAPFPFQQFAFDQPNIAVLYFPYVWLPACVVPLVLFSHLVSIRHLKRRRKAALDNRLKEPQSPIIVNTIETVL